MPIAGKERREDWEVVYEGATGLLDLYEEDPDSKGMNGILNGFRKFMEDLFTAEDEGRPIVWHNCGCSPELIRGFEGVQTMPIELLTVLQDLVGDVDYTVALIDDAEAHGVAPEVCSIDKAAVGTVLNDLYPEPVCTFYHNTPCDSQIAAIKCLTEMKRKPMRLMDVPYLSGDREVKYLAKQYREAIPFLEEHTGRKFNWDRFHEVCEESNRTAEYLRDWNELRRHNPCPQVSKIVALNTALLVAFSGDPEGTAIAKAFRDEAKERIERGESAVEGGELYRAVWYQDPVWWDLQFYDWMESELRLAIPMDLFGYYASEALIDTSSPESMLEGLARKSLRILPMSRQFKGPIDNFIDDYIRLCSDYDADFGIFAGHVACKHGLGGIGLFREASREADIPLLYFEFDMFDPRVTQAETIQEELADFIEDVVKPRKEAA
jgi:benzoyl-CoA reductase/2-hydroxyglutaryl-CoA dehydratase subunit BcrC/BadD/HgdB